VLMSISAPQSTTGSIQSTVARHEPSSTTRTLRVISWRDPLVEAFGFDPRSSYVERLWLPVIGPTCTWLLRQLAGRLEQSDTGFVLDLQSTALALGLGGRLKRDSPLARAVTRCVTFELARWQGAGTLAVRRLLPPLSRRHLLRLPTELQDVHDQWTAAQRQDRSLDGQRLRAQRLALGVVAMGDTFDDAEAQLLRWGIHPSLVHDAVAWARVRPAWPMTEENQDIGPDS
jgi:hypothetical protein